MRPYLPKQYSATTKTSDAAVTVLASIPIAENEMLSGFVEVTAVQSNAANGAFFQRIGLCRRKAGQNIEVVGSSSPATLRSDTAWDCTLGINTTTQSIEIKVRGKAGQTVYWFATLRLLKVGR